MPAGLPVHKLAACVGMVAGFAYLLLSGMSVSAVRAWLMAMLVLAAWLLDRLGLTLRNVGIAAFIVLLVSPLSLFTAGMQLSFAATAALVIWFEGRRHAREGRSRPRQVASRPDAASLVAGGATMPLTAYHFGTVAPVGRAGQPDRHPADRPADHAGRHGGAGDRRASGRSSTMPRC